MKKATNAVWSPQSGEQSKQAKYPLPSQGSQSGEESKKLHNPGYLRSPEQGEMKKDA